MERNRLIIIEGPQGTGKTTLANYLRENIPSSNLYRLSGQKDKSKTGKLVSKRMYLALLAYLKQMQDIPMDIIFDRTFFTEEVYARLGYKDYSFTDVYNYLVEEFNKLNYDIYLVLLYLKDPHIFEERLKREPHHAYQSFSEENSTNQQNMYQTLGEELRNTNIKVLRLAMDNFDEAYRKINKEFNI